MKFLTKAKAALGAMFIAASFAAPAKANSDLVLVQLTPTGWQVVTGQLTSLTTNVITGNQTAINILNNVSWLFRGQSYCISYGYSANDVLNAGTLAEALSIPGAASSSSGVPCLRSGAYLDPASVPAGNGGAYVKVVVVSMEPVTSAHVGSWPYGHSAMISLQNTAPATYVGWVYLPNLNGGQVGANYVWAYADGYVTTPNWYNF
jgi:hypothetical protein